jgi:hypothetical protein
VAHAKDFVPTTRTISTVGRVATWCPYVRAERPPHAAIAAPAKAAAWSHAPLGSGRARPLRLFPARLAAPCGAPLPEGEAGPLGAQPLPRRMPKLVISDGADSTAFASAGTWSNSTFVSGATASGKTPAEAAAMADDMFGRYEARVAADPSQHAMDYVHSYLHVAKGE